MRLLLTLLTAAVLVVSIVACSDSFSPTVENVAGDYTLDRLVTVTDTGGTKDWVAAGATFTISLATNGTTTGHLFLPQASDDGFDINADMTGTWTITGGSINFDQTADTFVKDWPLTAGKDRLTIDRTDAEGRVIVVLRK